MTVKHWNPAEINIKDFLTLFDEMEENVSILSFVAENYNSLPPYNFESLAAV